MAGTRKTTTKAAAKPKPAPEPEPVAEEPEAEAESAPEAPARPVSPGRLNIEMRTKQEQDRIGGRGA